MAGYSQESWWTSDSDKLTNLLCVLVHLSSQCSVSGVRKSSISVLFPCPALSGIVSALHGGADLQNLLLKLVLCLCPEGLDVSPLLLLSKYQPLLFRFAVGGDVEPFAEKEYVYRYVLRERSWWQAQWVQNRSEKSPNSFYIIRDRKEESEGKTLGLFYAIAFETVKETSLHARMKTARSGRQLRCCQVSCNWIWCLSALEGNEAAGRLFAKSWGKCREAATGRKSPQPL